MRSKVIPGPPPEVEYQWDASGKWCTLSAAGEGEQSGREPAPGSLEEFLTVRQWGYNGERGKATLEYRVEHPRWRVWHARNLRVDYTAEPLCGLDLAPELKTPISALIADGSAVTIHWRTEISA
jgi:hypothetical protein